MLASLTSEIASMGGNILALGTFRGEDPTNRMVTVQSCRRAHRKTGRHHGGPGHGDRGRREG